jgi:hypothetical protein
VRRRYIRIALAGLAALAVTGAAGASFRDVAGHWANSVVSLLEARGLVSGDEAARFRPDAPLTRAQLAKLLVSGLGHSVDADQLKGVPSRFTDLPAGHWSAGWVEALAELGVTAGYPDGTFQPDSSLTRAEVAVLLARAMGLPVDGPAGGTAPLPYADQETIPDWARGAVQATTAAGLWQGYEDGRFRPSDALTRAEGSAILYRLMTMKGRLIHLSGTLVTWSPATLDGIVRDALGTERSFQLAPDASLFQAGQVTTGVGIRQLDQVWIILGPDGLGRYMEARYRDLEGQSATVTGRGLSLQVGAQERRLTVQPGAVVYLNGTPSTLGEVDGANLVYIALDWMTGEVRAIDAVKASVQARLVQVVGDGPEFYATVGGEDRLFTVAPGVRPYLLSTGEVGLTSLPVDSQLYLDVDQAGLVRYLFVQR